MTIGIFFLMLGKLRKNQHRTRKNGSVNIVCTAMTANMRKGITSFRRYERAAELQQDEHVIFEGKAT